MITCEYEMQTMDLAVTSPISNTPPWLFPEAKIDLNILEKKGDWQAEDVGAQTHVYLRERYGIYLQIFTDGSKDKEHRVGVGVYIPEFKVSIAKRMPDYLSVYSAEAVAIITGLQWVEEVRPDRVVVCTDSLAVLKSLQTEKSVREDLIIEIKQYLIGLQRGGMEVQFCWVPAHKGLAGNEGADKLAKKALQQQI